MEICSEDEIVRLVHAFYARVRTDALLGPVFEAQVRDWPVHLAVLVDFWSAMLRGTRRFRGAPVSRHRALPPLSAAMYARWLQLFAQTTAESGNAALQAEADDIAARMAQVLQARTTEDSAEDTAACRDPLPA